MSVLEKMKNSKDFTESEKVVIAYILNHLEDTMYISINSLARLTFSSNSTIIRVCRKLGFNGFKDFKISLTKEVQSQKYMTHSVNFNIPFQSFETTHDIIFSISSLYKESLELMNANLNEKNIEIIANEIINCQRLFVFSTGDTKITTMSFTNRLNKLAIYPILSTENNEEIFLSHNVKRNDCVLFVSYRGDTEKNIRCLKIIKKSGCKVFSITGESAHILVKYSHCSIVIPNKEEASRIATYYSQIVFHYILNILFSVIYAKKNSK